MKKIVIDDRLFYVDESIKTFEDFETRFEYTYEELDGELRKLVMEYDFQEILKEFSGTGDVATIEIPVGVDNQHYKRPSFDASKKEITDLLKKKKIPDRVKKYVILNKNNNVWMKNKETGLSFNIKNFFHIKDITG